MASLMLNTLKALDIHSLTLLAICYPETDQRLLDLYRSLYQHQPHDSKWQIHNGPSTAAISSQAAPVRFNFRVQRHDMIPFELIGQVEQAVPVGNNGCEWLLVARGALWRQHENDSYNMKYEGAAIPCFYNSHSRKGFGLVPLVISYEMLVVSIPELQEEV